MQRYTVYFILKLLYMFRVVPSPIIRSANNCIYSIWYLSHRYCYLPLSWKSWNWFECAAGGVRHTCSGCNRIIPLMRRPNTDSTPNKPITFPRNQTFDTLRGHESRPHCHDTVLRYAVTLQVCTHHNGVSNCVLYLALVNEQFYL
jgi:hypothetical protein